MHFIKIGEDQKGFLLFFAAMFTMKKYLFQTQNKIFVLLIVALANFFIFGYPAPLVLISCEMVKVQLCFILCCKGHIFIANGVGKSLGILC